MSSQLLLDDLIWYIWIIILSYEVANISKCCGFIKENMIKIIEDKYTFSFKAIICFLWTQSEIQNKELGTVVMV